MIVRLGLKDQRLLVKRNGVLKKHNHYIEFEFCSKFKFKFLEDLSSKYNK